MGKKCRYLNAVGSTAPIYDVVGADKGNDRRPLCASGYKAAGAAILLDK